MYHLRKFKDNKEYKEYLASGDTWLPGIFYIINDHDEQISSSTGKDINMELRDWSVVRDSVNNLPFGGDNRRWVDCVNINKHFIEINGGALCFTDIQDVDLYNSYIYNGSTAEDASAATWYRAAYDQATGTIQITTPQGKATFDDSTGVLNFINFPNDYTVAGGPVDEDRYTVYFGFLASDTDVNENVLNTRVVLSPADETINVTNPSDGYQYYLALPDNYTLDMLSTVGAGELYWPVKTCGTMFVNNKLYIKYVTDGDDLGYQAGDYSFYIKTTKN